ncbi:unnamed protein product [Calicophoron daubneyi]|uniref:Uncharacterized protein n=1 Tax=Calicophoron daubneyi TaxID=300641 RepID=A0AAV2TXU8_CALDB
MNLVLRRFFSQVCMKTKRQGQRVRLSARNKEEVNKRNANYIPRIKRIAFKNVPRNFEIKWKDASFPAKRSEDEQNEESSTAKFRNKSRHLRKLLISGHSPTISQTESTLLVFRGGQRWHPNSYCNNTPKNSPGDSCADEEKLTLSGSPSCCTNCSFYEKYMTERLFSPSLLSSSADCSLFSSGTFSLSQAWALDQDKNAAWKIYQPKESFYAPLHVLSMRFSLPPLRPTSAPAILKRSKVY